jgi:excisionase family DNA binding protein
MKSSDLDVDFAYRRNAMDITGTLTIPARIGSSKTSPASKRRPPGKKRLNGKKPQPAVQSPLLTRDEAAEYLRCSIGTVDNLTAVKKLAACRIQRRIFYQFEELQRFIRDSKNGAA